MVSSYLQSAANTGPGTFSQLISNISTLNFLTYCQLDMDEEESKSVEGENSPLVRCNNFDTNSL